MEDATDHLTYERVALERRKLAFRRATNERTLREITLDHGRWTQWEDRERMAMVRELTAYVLAHEGGATASDFVVADLAIRPRWFPKFLWRRMPTRRVRWEIEATPEWIWPFSTLQLPESLGQPVEFMVTKTTKSEE